MAVTPATIRELRELTGAGMMDCKKALEENNGDIKKAIDYLREKGLSAAAKKAGRIAAEGICHTILSNNGKKGVIVEVNCETDFAAKGDVFKAYVEQVAVQALASPAKDIDSFLDEKWSLDPSLTVKEALSVKISTVGENINIRRFERFELDESKGPAAFCTYIHGGGRKAVLLELSCGAVNEAVMEAGKNVCMQIAALSPKFVSRDEISAEFLEKENTIITAAAINENNESDKPKPQNVLDNIIKGRVNKYLKEICLLDQEYVKDTQITVRQYLEAVSKEAGSPVVLKRFACYERGEGIEKKEDNFAEEVMRTAGQ